MSVPVASSPHPQIRIGLAHRHENFLAHPRAGLLVPDFARGRTLTISGEVEVNWNDGPKPLDGSTGRSWDLHVEHVVEASTLSGVEWEYIDASPFNP